MEQWSVCSIKQSLCFFVFLCFCLLVGFCFCFLIFVFFFLRAFELKYLRIRWLKNLNNSYLRLIFSRDKTEKKSFFKNYFIILESYFKILFFLFALLLMFLCLFISSRFWNDNPEHAKWESAPNFLWFFWLCRSVLILQFVPRKNNHFLGAYTEKVTRERTSAERRS